MRVETIIIGLALLISLAGCGAQQAEFVNRDEIDELIPEAQTHVRKVLDGAGIEGETGHFGKPTNMVLWERLPVHYHGAYGAFAETQIDEGADEVSTLNVSLLEQNLPVEPGQTLAWISGKYAGQASTAVAALNEAGNQIEIDPGLSVPPDAGDRFAIAPGAVISHGRKLYAEHCQHCHGVTGDGNGPTAKYLNPRPRDYRLGKFKFTSTGSSVKVTRNDLSQIVENGIPGTYMPSFKLLTEEENHAIVEYVRWLSMRGEIEFKLIQALRNDYSKEAVDSAVASARESDSKLSSSEARQNIVAEMDEYLTGDWVDEFNDDTKFLADQWKQAEDPSALVIPKVARVADTPESRARGRALYLSAKAKCATCHGDAGLGDGSQTLAVQKNPTTNTDYDVPGLFDDWGNPLKPRNLATGIYRGGRRPLDLYRRVHAGISGTPMPAFGTVLKDEEIWDIVNYVMHIPFESRDQRPGDGAGESVPASTEVATVAPDESTDIAN
ncbi:MAG: cytochrome c [Planctomycetaceae bacterium]|nr:cytochrome c [Planctomycetaceae bacterium]